MTPALLTDIGIATTVIAALGLLTLGLACFFNYRRRCKARRKQIQDHWDHVEMQLRRNVK